jgi:hypothetical protein
MAEALREAGCEVIACPDVYRALARMGGGRGELAAVVVCLDLMDAAQFEFFQLAGRHHRRLPVHVYAQAHAQPKIDLAVRLGAKGAVRVETVNEVLPHTAPSAAAGRSQAAFTESEPVGPTERQPVEAPWGAVGDTAGDDELGEVAGQVEEEPAGPTPVPWRPREGGPERIPPQRTGGEPASEEPSGLDPDSKCEPLLEPEELKALLGEEEDSDSTNGRGKRGKRR